MKKNYKNVQCNSCPLWMTAENNLKWKLKEEWKKRESEVLIENEMNGALGHESALQGWTGPGTTWANEINFVMNNALGTDWTKKGNKKIQKDRGRVRQREKEMEGERERKRERDKERETDRFRSLIYHTASKVFCWQVSLIWLSPGNNLSSQIDLCVCVCVCEGWGWVR